MTRTQQKLADIRPHTPPLGYARLTPFYDTVIALLTRERVWRKKFVIAISPLQEDRILDIGSGTGSLAKAILNRSPRTAYLGIDPDAEAIALAREKLSKQKPQAEFVHGFLNEDVTLKGGLATKVVSSLVLHQVPLEEKRRLLRLMFDRLQLGGEIHIADYGRQKPWLMKMLFRLTVQSLDGVENTQPNADGCLPAFIKKAGFINVLETDRIPTLTGVISIYRGEKSLLFGNKKVLFERKGKHDEV